MPEISSIQRQLALLQRQIKDLAGKIKLETDPDKKGILSKKLIDLNTKRKKLDQEMEDAVTALHSSDELVTNEGFVRWRHYIKQRILEHKKRK